MARWSLCCDGALERSCPGATDQTERTGQRCATQSVFRRVISCEDVKDERGRKKGQREKRRGVMLKLHHSAPSAQAPFQGGLCDLTGEATEMGPACSQQGQVESVRDRRQLFPTQRRWTSPGESPGLCSLCPPRIKP